MYVDTGQSNNIWLVVPIPLKKYEIPNIWKVIKAMFQTTDQYISLTIINHY